MAACSAPARVDSPAVWPLSGGSSAAPNRPALAGKPPASSTARLVVSTRPLMQIRNNGWSLPSVRIPSCLPAVRLSLRSLGNRPPRQSLRTGRAFDIGPYTYPVPRAEPHHRPASSVTELSRRTKQKFGKNELCKIYTPHRRHRSSRVGSRGSHSAQVTRETCHKHRVPQVIDAMEGKPQRAPA
jgi:hypothetical protein